MGQRAVNGDLVKEMSLNHPEDLEVTERALGKRLVQKIVIKKKVRHYLSQYIEVPNGVRWSLSEVLSLVMVIAFEMRKYEFSSFSFVFNFSFCLFCSICIKLEIEEKACIGFLLHRLPFITSFSEVPSPPLPHSFSQDPSLFDYWNYNIVSENSWIIIVIHWTTIISHNSMVCLNHPLLLHGSRCVCVCMRARAHIWA